PGSGRALRRVERISGRVGDHRRSGPGRGARVGGPASGSRTRADRGATAVGIALRCRIEGFLMDASATHAAADAIARRSYGRLVALLASRTGDLAAAEDALGDAFAAALAQWPRQELPRNPEAWLLRV